MKADIKVKDYYDQFIANAELDLKTTIEDRDKLVLDYAECMKHYETIKLVLFKYCSIKLINYPSIRTRIYDESVDELYDICSKSLYKIDKSSDISVMKRLMKICKLVKTISDIEITISINENRTNIKYPEYRKRVMSYYHEVQKQVLKGFGYKFSNGLGTLFIARWATDGGDKIKLDYNETNRRKRELIERGLTPYNADDAKWHEENNLPYDGVKYSVYRNIDYFYDINIIDSTIYRRSSLDFERTEYVHASLRGKGFERVSEECESFDEICAQPVDIKYKLNMILHKFPDQYLKYIRSYDENRSNYRKNYRKIRQ